MSDHSDALASFKAWEGEDLGENRNDAPGFQGFHTAPKAHLHIAGAWVMSSARRDGHGQVHPAVYLRQVAGVVGTGPRYHVLDGIVDADVAEDWGRSLIEAAAAARRDVEASS